MSLVSSFAFKINVQIYILHVRLCDCVCLAAHHSNDNNQTYIVYYLTGAIRWTAYGIRCCHSVNIPSVI